MQTFFFISFLLWSTSKQQVHTKRELWCVLYVYPTRRGGGIFFTIKPKKKENVYLLKEKNWVFFALAAAKLQNISHFFLLSSAISTTHIICAKLSLYSFCLVLAWFLSYKAIFFHYMRNRQEIANVQTIVEYKFQWNAIERTGSEREREREYHYIIHSFGSIQWHISVRHRFKTHTSPCISRYLWHSKANDRFFSSTPTSSTVCSCCRVAIAAAAEKAVPIHFVSESF